MTCDGRSEESIVRPPPRRDGTPVPPRVLLAAAGPDFERLRRRLAPADSGERLYLSRIFRVGNPASPCCLVGPFMGAPQAAMLMEALTAWGARQFFFLGWCGAIDAGVCTGDILLPTAAFVEEGTSRAYGLADDRVDLPPSALLDTLKNVMNDRGVAFHEGPVWSTDAVFQETPSKIRAYRRRGALAVEMEISACFTIARRRQVAIAAALVVSDELSTMQWRPGFGDPRFKDARGVATRIFESLCRTP